MNHEVHEGREGKQLDGISNFVLFVVSIKRNPEQQRLWANGR